VTYVPLFTRFRHWLIAKLAGRDGIAINLWIEKGGIKIGSRSTLVSNVVVVGAEHGLKFDAIESLSTPVNVRSLHMR
jgi:hypothetical protein